MMKSTATFVALTVIIAIVNVVNGSTCPCINTKELFPVCATDNKTYANPGEVACANLCEDKELDIASLGPCPCPCPNTREYFPVCANDGNTYVNRGAIQCHNQCNSRKIKIVKERPCRGEDIPLPY